MGGIVFHKNHFLQNKYFCELVLFYLSFGKCISFDLYRTGSLKNATCSGKDLLPTFDGPMVLDHLTAVCVEVFVCLVFCLFFLTEIKESL